MIYKHKFAPFLHYTDINNFSVDLDSEQAEYTCRTAALLLA